MYSLNSFLNINPIAKTPIKNQIVKKVFIDTRKKNKNGDTVSFIIPFTTVNTGLKKSGKN